MLLAKDSSPRRFQVFLRPVLEGNFKNTSAVVGTLLEIQVKGFSGMASFLALDM